MTEKKYIAYVVHGLGDVLVLPSEVTMSRDKVAAIVTYIDYVEVAGSFPKVWHDIVEVDTGEYAETILFSKN